MTSSDIASAARTTTARRYPAHRRGLLSVALASLAPLTGVVLLPAFVLVAAMMSDAGEGAFSHTIAAFAIGIPVTCAALLMVGWTLFLFGRSHAAFWTMLAPFALMPVAAVAFGLLSAH